MGILNWLKKGTMMGMFSSDRDKEFKELLEEAEELIHYASDEGKDEDLVIRGPLIEAVSKYKDSGEAPTADIIKTVHKHYTQLSLQTGEITGRSLLNTKNIFFHLKVIIFLSVTLLVISVGSELLELWLQDRIELDQGESTIKSIHQYILSPLAPFFWGGLGACVYLLKRLTDLAAARQFDKTKLQGWQTRVWLGAILGLVVQFIFDPTLMNSYGLSQNALAFLIGVGVKVFYGSIEKAIQVASEKLKLRTTQPMQEEYSSIEKFLRSQLAKTNKEEQKDKHKHINELISEIKKQYQAHIV
jgi:hypothetical protein